MKKSIPIPELKEEYIQFFTDVPVQKYAAQYIMRDEDTIIRWKNTDRAFADRVKRAEAEFIRKKMLSVKAEFALERLFKHVFTPREELEVIEPIGRAGTGTTIDLRRKVLELVKSEIRTAKPD